MFLLNFIKGSLGETAVGFDFAPPAIGILSGEDQATSNPTNWPIFILWGDGRIFYVITTLGTIQILRNQYKWVGGVVQMLIFYAKVVHFTNEVCLQGGWVEKWSKICSRNI